MPSDFRLIVPDPRRAEEEVRAAVESDPGMRRHSGGAGERQATAIMGVDFTDPAARVRVRRGVETIGARNASAAAARSELLAQRIRLLAQADSGTSKLMADLQDLAASVRALDPSHIDLRRQGLLGRLLNPTERYLEQFGSTKREIDDIVSSLVRSAEALRQSNVAIEGFEADVLAESRRLAADVAFADDLESALVSAIGRAKAEGADPDLLRFVEGDVLFSLEQRRQDLRGLLAVDQQAAIALSILRQTHATSIQSVRRTVRIVVRTLDDGARLRRALLASRGGDVRSEAGDALAVGSQGHVDVAHGHDGGAEGGAPSPEASLAALQSSFDEFFQAIEDGDAWRREALPSMRETIVVLQTMSEEMRERIERVKDAKMVPGE